MKLMDNSLNLPKIYFTNKYLKFYTINFLLLPKKTKKVAKINFNSKSDLMKKYLFSSTGKSEKLCFLSAHLYGKTLFLLNINLLFCNFIFGKPVVKNRNTTAKKVQISC
jgi:hypothetical protein